MDLCYGPEYEDFRGEVRRFLEGWPLTGDEASLPQAEQEALRKELNGKQSELLALLEAHSRLLRKASESEAAMKAAEGAEAHSSPNPAVELS